MDHASRRRSAARLRDRIVLRAVGVLVADRSHPDPERVELQRRRVVVRANHGPVRAGEDVDLPGAGQCVDLGAVRPDDEIGDAVPRQVFDGGHGGGDEPGDSHVGRKRGPRPEDASVGSRERGNQAAGTEGIPGGHESDVRRRVSVDEAEWSQGDAFECDIGERGQRDEEVAGGAREDEGPSFLRARLVGVDAGERDHAAEGAGRPYGEIVGAVSVDVTDVDERVAEVAGRGVRLGRLALRPRQVVGIVDLVDDALVRSREDVDAPRARSADGEIPRAVRVDV
jgi:hypothetical protein